MTKVALAHPDIWVIKDDTTQKIYYGCDQAWYPKKRQRTSGCGPSVASNILFYFGHTRPELGLKAISHTKEDFLALMEEVWKHVTPTLIGIPSTRIFTKGMESLAKSKQLACEYAVCNVPLIKKLRLPFTQVVEFIAKALQNDIPVAFLNLCNGQLTNLADWHWVTITALEQKEDKTWTTILDRGRRKQIDLGLWYETTTLGGGFVQVTFSVNERHAPKNNAALKCSLTSSLG